ncbi:hypothetical protein [Nostoc sp.]
MLRLWRSSNFLVIAIAPKQNKAIATPRTTSLRYALRRVRSQ